MKIDLSRAEARALLACFAQAVVNSAMPSGGKLYGLNGAQIDAMRGKIGDALLREKMAMGPPPLR